MSTKSFYKIIKKICWQVKNHNLKWYQKLRGIMQQKINQSWPGATLSPRLCGHPSPAPGHLFNYSLHQPRERYPVVMATRHRAHLENRSDGKPNLRQVWDGMRSGGNKPSKSHLLHGRQITVKRRVYNDGKRKSNRNLKTRSFWIC